MFNFEFHFSGYWKRTKEFEHIQERRRQSIF
jgi:hypothetical protein